MEHNKEIHEKAVLYTACTLIENGITTRKPEVSQPGVDLVLDNGKTILVRGLSNEKRAPITRNCTCEVNADYVIIATNLRYMYHRSLYILENDNMVNIARNHQVKNTGKDNWFINVRDYRANSENYGVLGA